MATKSIKRLNIRLNDAKRLIEIHTECTGTDRGRRHGYDALNRSSLMLTVAAWEGFIEDMLEAAVAQIVRNASGPSVIPKNVRDAMVAYLYQNNNWKDLSSNTKDGIWALTGRGWRKAYIEYARSKINALHTPNYENSKKLYSSIIGLSDLAAGWKTRRWKPAKYISELEIVLKLRHRIAHGAIGHETVGKQKAQNAVKLILQLANWTEAQVSNHLKAIKVPTLKK